MFAMSYEFWSAAQARNSFGSCQERRIFPFFHAPDRLGNEFVPITGDPSRGPGSYDYAERNNIIYHLAHRPESIRGYTMGARTTPRFAVIDKCVTPGPTSYQTILPKDQMIHPKYAVFSSKSPRFSQKVLDTELFPGPGTYDPYKLPHRHVTWPGKFGSPDWSLVPAPAKRTLKTELITDKAFRKQRNLLAYLSMYYHA
ncbi:ciliary microtubule-associated protein 3 isoform X2 [Heteronotia binoei]|uniref:ciliary microtubule-associated protein 3 isoform X2 n=1 Tax=Heteronotia binoei TaxID=13085 RepID=UPI0029314269|nr:ciliary microtubule-associated protein 3 isoform X2 [Heteronotia binoei]